MKKNLLISFTLVSLIVVFRLIPHIWNVAPVAAVALLAGAILPRPLALLVPLSGMLVSDIVIGFYHIPVMLTVYVSFALMSFIGVWLKKMQPGRLLIASLASSTLFFLSTNFAVWAAADWYAKTWEGLILCYTLAIPFFRNTMLGDLFYTGALFGVWLLVRQLVSSKPIMPVVLFKNKYFSNYHNQ